MKQAQAAACLGNAGVGGRRAADWLAPRSKRAGEKDEVESNELADDRRRRIRISHTPP
jgi:hypothetical protein